MSVPATALAPPIDRDYTLEHKYTRTEGRIYLSGVQALVRLPLMQQMRDRAAGLNTAGFISGYRGSPLGGFDLELWKAKKHLEGVEHRVPRRASTRISARRWSGARSRRTCFPARSTTACSRCGTARARAWIVAATCSSTATRPARRSTAACSRSRRDDHACRSSTLPHGSELEFVSAMMPVLNPAGVQDILDMGLLGWAMSRFTGRWVGFKTIAETVEVERERQRRSASARHRGADRFRVAAGRPQHPLARSAARSGNASAPDTPCRPRSRSRASNGIDRVVIDSPRARLGIVTTGKSYLDVLQALEYLGIGADEARDIGVRVYKVGMTWPLEPIGIREFARGLEDIVVVEEKRSFIESQMKEHMYNWEHSTRPTHRRQVRRSRRVGAAVDERADAGDDRESHRGAPEALLHVRAHRRAPAVDRREGSRARDAAREFSARRALLLGLSAQHVDRRCRKARARSAASAATTWSRGWTGAPTRSRRWAAKA